MESRSNHADGIRSVNSFGARDRSVEIANFPQFSHLSSTANSHSTTESNLEASISFIVLEEDSDRRNRGPISNRSMGGSSFLSLLSSLLFTYPPAPSPIRMPHTPGIVRRTPASILDLLNNLESNWPADESRSNGLSFQEWHLKAREALENGLQILAARYWEANEDSIEQEFPSDDLDTLVQAIDELVSKKYRMSSDVVSHRFI